MMIQQAGSRMPARLLRRLASRVLPRRTVRLRLTALYGVLFLVSGALLLAITSGLVYSRSSTQVARAASGQGPQSALAQARSRIQTLEHQLAAESRAQQAGISQDLLIASAIGLGIMTVMSVALGWGVSGRALRPLRQMTAAARRISEDNLHERLAMSGPDDEMKDLADTIDGLLGRLEGAFAAQRRFVANASHELRTPLTTMRASLDVAMAKPEPAPPQTVALARRLRTELDQVDRLLEGFLALARAQHASRPGYEMVSLSRAVAVALDAQADAVTARNLRVDRDGGDDGAWVSGDATLLGRMVGNVIDNAVGHNQDGGWIRVASGTSGFAWMIVETGGPVLDQRQVAELAQPFRRLGADRTGTDRGAGLGLSIVAAIATAHGGVLDLQARPEGGLRVSIGLPRAAGPVADRLAGAQA
ncbi:MAG TPA: HAMP domain-containing sensor histidine kinase [Streptosporangiaceae bacterium]|nr:HAMP domain-containing sensor histidine kinase [Streptosporangiaceae bacterium]